MPDTSNKPLSYKDAGVDIDAGDALVANIKSCLLYTSDAADERSSVDLGGRRIIKKKKSTNISERTNAHNK